MGEDEGGPSANVGVRDFNLTDRVLAGALLSLALSLLLVGWVSGTVIRHVVQIVPAVIVGVAVVQRRSWGPMAALPILAFWLIIMILIWLHVLGMARVVSGRFSASEIVLTIVMGISCVAGVVASIRTGLKLKWAAGLFTFLFFAALQIGFMLLSFRSAIADR